MQKHLRVRAEDIKKKINRHDVRIDKRDKKDKKLRSRRLLIDDKGRGTWNYYRWNRKSGQCGYGNCPEEMEFYRKAIT